MSDNAIQESNGDSQQIIDIVNYPASVPSYFSDILGLLGDPLQEDAIEGVEKQYHCIVYHGGGVVYAIEISDGAIASTNINNTIINKTGKMGNSAQRSTFPGELELGMRQEEVFSQLPELWKNGMLPFVTRDGRMIANLDGVVICDLNEYDNDEVRLLGRHIIIVAIGTLIQGVTIKDNQGIRIVGGLYTMPDVSHELWKVEENHIIHAKQLIVKNSKSGEYKVIKPGSFPTGSNHVLLSVPKENGPLVPTLDGYQDSVGNIYNKDAMKGETIQIVDLKKKLEN